MQSNEKPAIVLPAPELSHRFMSSPSPLIGGSDELLLNQRGLGLHITMFKCMFWWRGQTKGNSSFEQELGARTLKDQLWVWFSRDEVVCLIIWIPIRGCIWLHACLLGAMCADPLTSKWVLYLEYGRSLVGFSGHGRCLVGRRHQISAWAMWHTVSKRGRTCKRNWRVAIKGLMLRRM